MLFSEPKIPQPSRRNRCSATRRVSVLFSEPKIPQPRNGVGVGDVDDFVSVLFSEPKIPQTRRNPETPSGNGCFSALQRAENSSKEAGERRDRGSAGFQCSSASRKFLKRTRIWGCAGVLTVSVLFSEPKIPQTTTKGSSQHRPASFSALQRAENSSKASSAPSPRRAASVSVLFSEPKIPQIGARIVATIGHKPFQCSSASRKFLKRSGARRASKR